MPRSNAQYHEQRTAPSSVQFDADFIIEVNLFVLKHISSALLIMYQLIPKLKPMRLQRDDKTDLFLARAVLWIHLLMNPTLNHLCPLPFYARSISIRDATI